MENKTTPRCRSHEPDFIERVSHFALKYFGGIAKNATPKMRFFQTVGKATGNYLDIGCHAGNTIRRFIECGGGGWNRAGIDKEDYSELVDDIAQFHQLDVTKDLFPIPSEEIDVVTIVHLIEHLSVTDHIFKEVYRVLKPGGKVYVETPGLRRMLLPSFRIGLRKGKYRGQAINFFDDPTHVNIWTLGKLYYTLCPPFEIEVFGVARNRILALFGPFMLLYGLTNGHRTFLSQGLQNILGVNIYAVARKPLRN